MSDKLLLQAGLELVKILLNGAFNLSTTLKIPPEEVDAEFQKAKAEFERHGPPTWRTNNGGD